MIDKKAFKQMRVDLERFDECREELIKSSRDLLKLSKGSIYSLHRNDFKKASEQLGKAKLLINKLENLIKRDAHLAAVGAYSEALEEYTEAACYYGFVKDKKLPTAEKLGVDADIYLPGLCDLIGELVRRAINSSIKGEYKTAVQIKDFVTEVYEELMLFDFRNIPVRKKFDSIKYGLEKLEALILDLKLKGKLKS